VHLLKENSLEEDEIKEIVERLATLVEEYKLIGFDSDQSDEESDDNPVDGDSDY